MFERNWYYTSRPGHPADNSYQYWRLSSALDIAPEPGWNFPIRFGRGEFELVPNGTAGVELHEDGFMAFASEPDYLFSGRNEYDASTPSLHITIANGGLYVVVGSPNELSVWGDGITLPTLPPTPTPPPPPFPTYGVGPFSVFGTIQSPFGQGVAPAVIGIKGWHQNTLDVMPVHLEECLADLNNLSTGNYSSCDPSDGQGVEIFSPIGGAVHVIQDGQGENSQVVIRPNGVVLTINIGGQQVDVYPEIHFSHLDPGTVSGGGASAGGALARLCTEANKSSCDLGQRDPSHLAYAVRFQSVANFDRHSPDVLNARAVIASPHCLYDEFETQSFATCPGN
jgi:hypothetical protein